MNKLLPKLFIALFLSLPVFISAQNISLDDDGDGDISSGDTHETIQGAGDEGIYEHIGDLTFKSGVNFSNKLQAETVLGIGGDDTYDNYVIIEGNLTVEGGSTVDIGNSSLLIITGDVNVNGDIEFHNAGYVIILGDVTGSGTISNGSGGGALPAYIGGTVSDAIISSGNVDSPLNIDSGSPIGQTVNDILDDELPTDWQSDLPVELISFTASLGSNSIEVNWSTATEINASHFEVYSSTDNRNWDLLGEVEANGNSSSRIDYSFYDNKEYSASVYYKLIQYDFDGQNETFGPILVQTQDNEITLSTSVFPNPSFNGNTNIQIGGIELNSQTSIQVMNKDGKIIFKDNLENDITSTVYQLGNKITLTPGIYILMVSSGFSQKIERVIIQ